jgi:hypothetical protein
MERRVGQSSSVAPGLTSIRFTDSRPARVSQGTGGVFVGLSSSFTRMHRRLVPQLVERERANVPWNGSSNPYFVLGGSEEEVEVRGCFPAVR